MKKSHPAFWAAGWAGMAAGTVLTGIGLSAAGDIANLAGGYGLMVVGSALYLLAGLKLRDRFAVRRTSVVTSQSTSTASGSTVTAAGRW